MKFCQTTLEQKLSCVNEKIFKREDAVINMIYDIGRQWSLDYFEVVYATLGTKFDNYFFESKEGMLGEAVVKQNIEKGVFVESEGAIIFKGEDHGVHTRVFITSQGLPTYETKEIGLNTEKFRIYPDLEKSIIVTASEQNDYFKVLLKVFEIILPNIYTKTKHISHGMMRLSSGKMGSRKGNVVAGDDLIFEIENMVREKMKENDFPQEEKDKIAQDVAVSAIKYTILRQSIGNDIIFDSSASISFEGDSGPYLQYSAVRAGSVIRKAQADSQFGDIYEKAIKINYDMPEKVGELERMIIRFFDAAQRSYAEYAPQLIAHYLIQLAGLYNSYYAKQVILDEKDPLSPYRLALTMTFEKIMKKGLWLLGIRTPERM
jgi:arginyl-tRNA synthetase